MIRRLGGFSSDPDAPSSSESPNDMNLIDIESGAYDSKRLDRRSVASASRDVPILGPANNLTNIIIGVGVLSLPYALKSVGVITGLLMLLTVGCGTISSYTLLLKTKKLTGHASYESLSFYLFGSSVSTFIKCIIILGTIAALTAYLTIIADSTQKYVLDFLDPESALATYIDKKTILAFAMIIIIPLSLTKRIESLTWTSTISLMPLFYLMALLLVYFLNNETSPDTEPSYSVPLFAPNFFVALPICTFAFSSQVGSIPIFAEMEQHYGATQSDMLKVAIISIGSSFFFYAVCGILGLLTFADAVHSNIVLSFDKSPAVDVLLVSMIISVALGYPFSLFPCRDSIQSLLFPGRRECRKRTVILTLIIVAISYFIASFTSFSSILSLSGGFTGTITGYILPSAFYLKATKDVPMFKDRFRILALVVLIVGSLAGFMTTTITITGFMRGSAAASVD